MLLPPGFCDLTGASAKKHFFILKYCLEYFFNNSYELVLPSIFEYESQHLDENAIQVVDPLNNKIMHVRNDITAQISRIWQKEGQKNPKKFCYYGDVIYRQDSHNNTDFSRKLTQTGIEYITDNSLERDLDVIKIILEILSGLEIKDFSIVISFPNLFNNYCKLLKATEQEKENLKTNLIDKNITAIKNSKFSALEKFIIPGSFSTDDIIINGLEKDIDFIKSLLTACTNLFPKLDMVVDPFYIGESRYHTDFAFSVISNKLKRAIARGGSYDICATQSAVGASFYIEELSLA